MNLSARIHVIAEVIHERQRQVELFGLDTGNDDGTWMAVLAEEVGEVAHELIEGRRGHDTRRAMRQELIEVAAVAVAWIEAMDHECDGREVEHA